MNNVEAGGASTHEGSEQCYIFHVPLISSQWHDATESSNLIYCYHLEVGTEYSNPKICGIKKKKKPSMSLQSSNMID